MKPRLTGAALAAARNKMVHTLVLSGSYESNWFKNSPRSTSRSREEIDDTLAADVDKLLSISYDLGVDSVAAN